MRSPRPARIGTLVAAGLLLAAVLPALPSPAASPEVTVDWHEDETGFTASSEEEISNVWVELCAGSQHKHDELGTRTYTHREAETVAGVWVKSGANGQPDNRPPGAGERFDNPSAECETDERCDGPQTVQAEAADPTIEVHWATVEGAESYDLYRDGGGGFEHLATLAANTTEYTDTKVEPETTYTYIATATVDGLQTGACDEAGVTAIPSFPTAFAFVMASITGVATYGAYRYRAGR